MFLAKKQNKCAIKYQEKYVTRFLVKFVSKFLGKFVTKLSVRNVATSLVKFVSRCPRLNVGTCQNSSALQCVSQPSSAKCVRMMNMEPPKLQFRESTERQQLQLFPPIKDELVSLQHT